MLITAPQYHLWLSWMRPWYKHDTEQAEREIRAHGKAQLHVNGTGKTIILILYWGDSSQCWERLRNCEWAVPSPLCCLCDVVVSFRNGNSWFMLHYGPVSGNEHAQGEDSSRYDRCGKRQSAAWFSTFHEAWKNNFSKRLTTRERKKWQWHQKVLALVCANMCVCVLVPSFSMGNIWSGEIWPVPPFRFPPVVPRVSKPGTVNKCLFSAQVHVADPNSMAGKPGACPSSQSKLKKKKKTILYHSSPHFLRLLTQRELKRFACGWMCTCV